MTYLAPCYSYKNGTLYIDDVSLDMVAQSYETPFYIYSATQIKQNIQNLNKALTQVLEPDQYTVCYACKALNNIAVMHFIAQQGCGADIVSSGELTRAIKASVPTDKIVFSGVGKSDQEIEHALNSNIRQINVESGAELYRIEHIAKSLKIVAPVVFRLNPDVKAGAHDKISTGQKENKFGLNAQSVMELYQYAADSEYINPRGISLHIGSQLIDMSPFDTAYKIAADFIQGLRAKGFTPDTIDLGGGIGIIYDNVDAPDLDAYARIVEKHIAPLGLHMIFEPGRMIVGNAGLLVSRVLYIKEAENKSFLITDAGMNDLMRPALYDSLHPVVEITPKGKTAPVKKYDVVGPVCESADVFGLNIPLSEELTHNDLVAFTGAGAYGATMSSYYNARKLPAEFLVEGNDWRCIRRAITVEDFLRFETIDEDIYE